MKFTEEELKKYAKPLSDSEEEQCKRAIRMVGDALKGLGFSDDGKEISKMYDDTHAYQLSLDKGSRKIKLFIQGSYANNTNVRTQSDVDIAVVEEDTFQTDYREGVTRADYGFEKASPRSETLKDEVERILKAKFGRDVERKNKSIKINGNSGRKDADTIPCQRYRDYRNDYRIDETNYIHGVVIHQDNGREIINYPEQHIANGKQKNNETKYTYKRMVRILKKMRYIMKDNGFSSAENVSSFGLESLLWNIPNEIFTKYSSIYRYCFDKVVKYLFENKHSLTSYKEANGIKNLFPEAGATSEYQAFIDDLKKFYEYDF